MSDASTSHKRRQIGYAVILVVSLILLYFLVVREMRFFRVPSSSMEPTLLPGDFILTLSESAYHRGDIVVLDDPEIASGYLVKRIAGVAGDRVRLEYGALLINGEYASEPYLPEPVNYTMAEEVLVPEGGVFVLGDNRNHSGDSSNWRENPGWEGPCLAVETITGKVRYRYLPVNRMRAIRSYPLTNVSGQ